MPNIFNLLNLVSVSYVTFAQRMEYKANNNSLTLCSSPSYPGSTIPANPQLLLYIQQQFAQLSQLLLLLQQPQPYFYTNFTTDTNESSDTNSSSETNNSCSNTVTSNEKLSHIHDDLSIQGDDMMDINTVALMKKLNFSQTDFLERILDIEEDDEKENMSVDNEVILLKEYVMGNKNTDQ